MMTSDQADTAVEDLTLCIAVFCSREEQALSEAIEECATAPLPEHVAKARDILKAGADRGIFTPWSDDGDFMRTLAEAAALLRGEQSTEGRDRDGTANR